MELLNKDSVLIQAIIDTIEKPVWVEKNGNLIAANQLACDLNVLGSSDSMIERNGITYLIAEKHLNHNTELILKELLICDDIRALKNATCKLNGALSLL